MLPGSEYFHQHRIVKKIPFSRLSPPCYLQPEGYIIFPFVKEYSIEQQSLQKLLRSSETKRHVALTSSHVAGREGLVVSTTPRPGKPDEQTGFFYMSKCLVKNKIKDKNSPPCF